MLSNHVHDQNNMKTLPANKHSSITGFNELQSETYIYMPWSHLWHAVFMRVIIVQITELEFFKI